MITVILLGAGAIVLVGVIVLVMASGNKRSGKSGELPPSPAVPGGTVQASGLKQK